MVKQIGLMRIARIAKVAFLGAIVALQFGCGDKNNSPTVTTTPPGYMISNGTCYTTAGQPVAPQYCNGTAGTGVATQYYWNGSSCVHSQTGQVVPSTYCQGVTGTVGVPGQVGGQCYGYYYYNSGYGWQLGQCAGSNCSGQTLYDQSGNQVYCQ